MQQELRQHPFETTALLAMLAAFARLSRKGAVSTALEDAGPETRRKWRLAPLGIMAAICMLGLASCLTGSSPRDGQAPADAGLVAEGRDLVERECASCHAIGQGSVSPHPEAPPLKTVLAMYNQDSLTSDLIEGVRVGHDDMPLFDFNVIAADALVAYLRSISSEPKPGAR